MKFLSLALAISLASIAPFQCGKPDMNKRVEDSAPEALWKMSERFRRSGEDEARRLTLETIVEEYPTSREAQRAKLALEGKDVSDPETAGAEDEP